MQEISSTADLKKAIEILKAEQLVKAEALKNQFAITYDSLKPVNLLKDTLNELVFSRDLMNDIFSAVSGLVSGYLSKKIFVGSSAGKFRKLIGTILQIGVTGFIARHAATIKEIVRLIFESLLHNEEVPPAEE